MNFFNRLTEITKRRFHNNSLKGNKGLTLIETLVGTAIFVVVATSSVYAYIKVMEVVRLSQLKIIATQLANEQFEIARNLTYADVGVSGGIPNGKLEASKTVVRDGISFDITTTVRNIDDPFDGQIGQEPNDLSPADYKLVALEITCPSCKNFSPISFTTQIAPFALETASTNGALFVEAFDSSGSPVVGANVHVENNSEFPPIVIDDTTNADGVLQIVDAPPGAGVYEITVTKDGYTTDKTYLPGDEDNPNPLKSHTTVVTQLLTEISFFIDKLSSFSVESVTPTCTPVGNIDFTLAGSKLIGADPDILKYPTTAHVTDSSGSKLIPDLEWDTYDLNLTDGSYDLAGAIPTMQLVLTPNTNTSLKMVVLPKNPKSLLVTVKDAGTALPLTDTDVHLVKQGGGFDTTLVTGKGFMRQTDWSGGFGQDDFIDETMFFSTDDNVEINDPAGELKLLNIFGQYQDEGTIISSTFDLGSASNFHQITWSPQAQPSETGTDSIKFQIATNDDNETWDFVGPDGTESTYYTTATPDINSMHDGDRYFRYKAYLSTEDPDFTPDLGEVDFTFLSSCVPPGQTFFSGLSNGIYDLTISKDGYGEWSNEIDISNNWTEQQVSLTP